MTHASCSIFFHNYYGQHEDWIKLLSEKVGIPFTLFYHIVEDSLFNLEEGHQQLADRLQRSISGTWLKKIILRQSPNQGKDIGGKLVLMDTYLQTKTESDYIIFLHDKKSPYAIQNQEWKDKLFRIIEPGFVAKALAFLKTHPRTGLIAPADTIMNEFDPAKQSFTSNNRSKLEQWQKTLGIDLPDYRYAAGTMFWARSSPLMDFFRGSPPLDIRKTLEKGNSMDEKAGTNTHAWERLLSWLIFARGYTIKGF